MESNTLRELTADIVTSAVANNTVAIGEVRQLIESVYRSLSNLGEPAADPHLAQTPIVPVKGSVKPDYIVCLQCGKRQKMLKRHLNAAHGIGPAEYRAQFGLPDSYPMVSANYSAKRRELALSIGLGRGNAKKTRKASKKR